MMTLWLVSVNFALEQKSFAMKTTRPKVLMIGGFDPSGGAGILADTKTAEQHKVLAMAVSTANTVQTEDQFIAVNWVDEQVCLQQLEVLLARYSFEVLKIGLIPSVSFGLQLVERIRFGNNKSKIIWDPVLSASAGFDFEIDLETLDTFLSQLFLITPNWKEAERLSQLSNLEEGWTGKPLAKHCRVLLKGGHREDKRGYDTLLIGKNQFGFKPKVKTSLSKHGTGCILASSIVCNIAKGYPIHKSILKAKKYVSEYLVSNQGFLGYHK